MFLGLPVWGWLGIAFAIALVLGFVFYSNSERQAGGRHGAASILQTVAPAGTSTAASSNRAQ